MEKEIETEVVVLGSGPGGYAAAFRAADLGKKVLLVERYETLGGVCLNVGCIPSKTLLHIAKVIDDVHDIISLGISFGKPKLDIKKIRGWKESVIKKLTGGLKMMAKQRKVELCTGFGKFTGINEITVEKKEKTVIRFEKAIIAVGSLPIKLPFLPEDPRIIDSTGALELENTKIHLLVLGGGIIGLEMATVYHALGAKISIVERMDQIIPGGADADIVKPLYQRIQNLYEAVLLKTSVTKVEAKKDGLYVTFEGENAPTEPQKYDCILVAVGRTPNGKLIDAEKAGVKVDGRGYISVDKQMRTNVPHIYAIGDVVGQPMLAHKATYEGRLVAEVIADEKKHYNDARCIPAVAYTDPEVAWVGITENKAKKEGIKYKKGVLPWVASGRALSLNRSGGFTKLLFDENSRVIGGGIVGVNAGDLISEVALAIEMGCDAEDLALTIHPHPTLSETVMMACEMHKGTITDLIPIKE